MSVDLSKLITKDNIVFFEAKDMEETVNFLTKKAFQLGKVNSESEFLNAVLDRESLVSTGIGLGVAIPHAKLDNIEDFFIVVGINKKGIDWDAIDRKPVGAVFLIGGPSDEQKKYLQIIAKLMLLIKNGERREKLLNAKEEYEIVDIFHEF